MLYKKSHILLYFKEHQQHDYGYLLHKFNGPNVFIGGFFGIRK